MSQQKQFYLVTDRFRLRDWEESDLSKLVELDSDPEVMRFITGGKPTDLEQIRDVIFPTVRAYRSRYEGELGNWIVEDRSTSEFIGWFHLRPDKKNLDDRARVELGYRLKRESWGKGIATEVACALIEKAWRLGVREVFARAHHQNLKSIKVMERAGMTFEFVSQEPELDLADKTVVRYAIRNPNLNDLSNT